MCSGVTDVIVALHVGAVCCEITCNDMQQPAALDEIATVAQVHVMACVRELAEAGVEIVDGED